MTVIRKRGTEAILVDILDRVLDNGIIIDPWARATLAGIDVVTEKTRVVVASLRCA